ncbi:MAG: acyloxyacyl hydrolase, partial [Thermoanaerobaculia bacterium]
HPRDTAAIFTFIAGAGIVLYGASLGVIPVDIYRAGFSPLAVIALAIAGTTIAPRAPRAAAVALLVLVTFELHLLSSRNLFDYVIDPLITAAILLRSIAWLAGRVMKTNRFVAFTLLLIALPVAGAGLPRFESNAYLSEGICKSRSHGTATATSLGIDMFRRFDRLPKALSSMRFGASLQVGSMRQPVRWFHFTPGEGSEHLIAGTLSIFARYYWERSGVVPFVELGSGPMLTSKQVPEASSRFNMESKGGAGLVIGSAGAHPVTVIYRFSHVSNAGTAYHNPGLNFHTLLIAMRLSAR